MGVLDRRQRLAAGGRKVHQQVRSDRRVSTREHPGLVALSEVLVWNGAIRAGTRAVCVNITNNEGPVGDTPQQLSNATTRQSAQLALASVGMHAQTAAHATIRINGAPFVL